MKRTNALFVAIDLNRLLLFKDKQACDPCIRVRLLPLNTKVSPFFRYFATIFE